MSDDDFDEMLNTVNAAGVPPLEDPMAPSMPGSSGAAAASAVASATIPSLSPSPVGGPEASLDMILDIPVTLSMEIGKTRIPIGDLLQFNPGSVIELDHMVGEPMDVLVNGTLIAHGEVVVVNDKFGIRLTDVVSPSERVKGLK